MPPPSQNVGIKLHGTTYNDWLDTCKPDEWCNISVEGPSSGGDAGHILLILDSMGGPRTVNVRELKCDVFENRGAQEPMTTLLPLKASFTPTVKVFNSRSSVVYVKRVSVG